MNKEPVQGGVVWELNPKTYQISEVIIRSVGMASDTGWLVELSNDDWILIEDFNSEVITFDYGIYCSDLKELLENAWKLLRGDRELGLEEKLKALSQLLRYEKIC